LSGYIQQTHLQHAKEKQAENANFLGEGIGVIIIV
jgi:hypothetical protein